MSSELSILALYGLLIMLVIIIQASSNLSQFAINDLIGSRDDLPKLSGVPGRLERAAHNSVVAMVLFAPAILILHAKEGFGPNTLMAAQVFLVARIIYVVVYATGTPWVRSLAWSCGLFATAYLYILAI